MYNWKCFWESPSLLMHKTTLGGKTLLKSRHLNYLYILPRLLLYFHAHWPQHNCVRQIQESRWRWFQNLLFAKHPGYTWRLLDTAWPSVSPFKSYLPCHKTMRKQASSISDCPCEPIIPIQEIRHKEKRERERGREEEECGKGVAKTHLLSPVNMVQARLACSKKWNTNSCSSSWNIFCSNNIRQLLQRN